MDERSQPHIGALVRWHRRRAQLTQEALAERSGLSIRAVRDLESGRVGSPRPSSLARLADALGLSASDRDELAGRALPALHIGILGPLLVRRQGLPVDPGPPAHRTLLGLLTVRAGDMVSRDEIVDVLWGDDPPRSAIGQIQSAVSRLRRIVDTERRTRLLTGRYGYQLRLAGGEADAAEFTAQLAAGRLEEALSCWRGPVLADAPARLRTHPMALALGRRRLEAAISYAGPERTAVDMLRTIAAEDPLHEPLHARLVVALARTGDRAAALRVHAEITERLAGELGVVPGEELRAAYREAAGTEEPAWIRPAQLPAPAPGFVGRHDALHRMDKVRSAVCVVTGTAGVGKTALAVQWAHTVRAEYPDGQLYADLRGFDPSGARTQPASVLHGFIEALGVPAGRVPAAFDARSALYRSLLAGKKVLVVLDNARDVEQVRPLLPGTPGCRALVTSRDQLRGLIAAEGAEAVTLDLLSLGEAVRLLAARIGTRRAYADVGVTEDIAERCARLPLALGVVAARAALYPAFPLERIAADLRQDDDLDGFGDVRTVFSWSYHTLGADAAQLFGLCAALPGPDFAAPAAQSIAAWPAARARSALGELVRAHLVTEYAPGRFTLHDLLRGYASGLLPDRERRPAVIRALDHYRATAIAAARLLEPHREPITPEPIVDGVSVPALADADRALAWLTAERSTLLAAVDLAAGIGEDARAWELAWALLDYLDNQGHWADWVAVERVALTSARRGRDPGRAAFAHRLLGRAYVQLGRYAEAEPHYEAALELYDREGDLAGGAHTRMSRSWMHMLRGRRHAAQRDRLTALARYERAGHEVGTARALNAVGWGYAQLGDFRRSLHHCRRALVLAQALDDTSGCAAIWDSIGYAYLHLGDHEEAIDCLRRSAGLFRAVHDLFNEADVLVHLGDAYGAANRPDEARPAWEAALAIFERLGHAEVETVRGRLKD